MELGWVHAMHGQPQQKTVNDAPLLRRDPGHGGGVLAGEMTTDGGVSFAQFGGERVVGGLALAQGTKRGGEACGVVGGFLPSPAAFDEPAPSDDQDANEQKDVDERGHQRTPSNFPTALRSMPTSSAKSPAAGDFSQRAAALR